jgi:hypothetical protein
MSTSTSSDLLSDGASNNEKSDTYMQFLRARKSMEVKKVAEKFRVGSKVRLLERKALTLQNYIASVSMISILLAVLIQEISFYGTYSNEHGGDWFSKKNPPSIPASRMITTEDLPIVTLMKFFLTKLTIVQLFMMSAQFRIITLIMIEQKQLDLNLQEGMDFDAPVVTLTGSFGYSSSYLLLLKFCLELAVCGIHPMPFAKHKFITTIVGRDAIYNVESLVTCFILFITFYQMILFLKFHFSWHWPFLPDSIIFGDSGRSGIIIPQQNFHPLSCSILQLWMFKSYLGRDSALAGENVRQLLNKVWFSVILNTSILTPGLVSHS